MSNDHNDSTVTPIILFLNVFFLSFNYVELASVYFPHHCCCCFVMFTRETCQTIRNLTHIKISLSLTLCNPYVASTKKREFALFLRLWRTFVEVIKLRGLFI